MTERPTREAPQHGSWRENRPTVWVLIGVFAVLTAGTPLCFYLVPGFLAYLVFAALMLICWIVAVAILIPASAARR